MCECGCTMNDTIYTLPGPRQTLYVIRLSGACVSCDGPPGVTIEQYRPGQFHYDYYRDPEHSNGPLPLERWSDGLGAAIVCGMRKHEFVRATKQHLVGVSSDEMGEKGRIDAGGAEIILEEMYEDATSRPALVKGGV